jgi:hypothetical protein
VRIDVRLSPIVSKENVRMGKKIRCLPLLWAALATGVAAAAPCPNLEGTTWDITLSCVGINPSTNAAFFGPRTVVGVITEQNSCAFAGTLFSANDWVGVLSGSDGSTVNFDWAGAVGTGELTPNRKRMTFTYTLAGDGTVATTACTGRGVRRPPAP